MSKKHPIISVTGSSGAGTTTIKNTFDQIFRRESITAVSIEGDAFHRFDRAAMKAELTRRTEAGDHTFSHFSIEANELERLEQVFRHYGETGTGPAPPLQPQRIAAARAHQQLLIAGSRLQIAGQAEPEFLQKPRAAGGDHALCRMAGVLCHHGRSQRGGGKLAMATGKPQRIGQRKHRNRLTCQRKIGLGAQPGAAAMLVPLMPGGAGRAEKRGLARGLAAGGIGIGAAAIFRPASAAMLRPEPVHLPARHRIRPAAARIIGAQGSGGAEPGHPAQRQQIIIEGAGACCCTTLPCCFLPLRTVAQRRQRQKPRRQHQRQPQQHAAPARFVQGSHVFSFLAPLRTLYSGHSPKSRMRGLAAAGIPGGRLPMPIPKAE